MCSYSKQILWDADALNTLKPFAAAGSYRQKQNIYKELHLPTLNTGALSSGVYVCDPWKRLRPTCHTSRKIKETQQTTVNDRFIQTFINLLNYMDYWYNSVAITACLLMRSPPRRCSKRVSPARR